MRLMLWWCPSDEISLASGASPEAVSVDRPPGSGFMPLGLASWGLDIGPLF